MARVRPRRSVAAPRRVLGAAVAACLATGPLLMSAQAWAAEQPAAPSVPDARGTASDRPLLTGAGPAAVKPTVLASGAFVIDATSAASSSGGNEPSIAVNPANPNQIAITRFNQTWNSAGTSNADLLYSTDGGITWTNETSIPPPPGLTDVATAPRDQTIDFGSNGTLYGTFLTCNVNTSGNCTAPRVVTGSTTDPTKPASWSWNGNPAQLTSGTRTNVDQPWLLVNRDTTTASQDDVYVGYQDFGGSPDARVAVSRGASPVNFATDNKAGTESPLNGVNGGLRLAKDPRNGTMYALYQQSTGTANPWNVTYKLNRSTDAGANWTLGGSTDGISVATVSSDQGFTTTAGTASYKFGGVNALFGGVDHAAVDPSNGDVYVVYGQNNGGNNQLMVRRITFDTAGTPTVGGASTVSTSTNTALPSVAVLTDGTIGVLYLTSDGNNTSGLPTFSAHLARSTNQGGTFTDTTLASFSSPVNTNTQLKQRVFGDFEQLKAVGTTFYGTFPGHSLGTNPTTTPPIDAMFFSIPQATESTLTSSANPSVYGQPVSFTATVNPVPDGGTVSFTVDGSPLGSAVAVDTTTGQATSASIATLSVGDHNVVATYSGDPDFKGSTTMTLVQTVNQAAVSTTLTPSANPSAFGQSVTFTDTVCAAPPSTDPALPPSGTVTFQDGTTLLGTGTLAAGGGTNCSQAQVSFANLLPGTHTITAQYGGDTNYLAGDLESISQTVNCVNTITGDVNGGVVASGASTCIIGATVHGAVHGAMGGALFISDSTIHGSVMSANGTLFGMCGSTVEGGSVHVGGASGFVVIGDPGDDGCAGNRITGSVQLNNNHGGAELVANQIGGSTQVNGTTGTGPFPEDTQAEIEGNTIGGGLSCAGNTPPPVNGGDPNTVSGPRMGQCSAL